MRRVIPLLLVVTLLMIVSGVPADASYNHEIRYLDNGDGTVTDIVTGLMWQQANSPQKLSWENAIDYAEGITLGGYSDWRLPDINELETLFEYKQYDPDINATMNFVFEGAFWLPYYRYWSSNTDLELTTYAWGAIIINDSAGSIPKTARHIVRAVRSDTYGPFGTLTVSIEPDGAVINGARWRRTGTLAWYNSNSREVNIPPGTYDVEFKHVTSLIKPAWIQPENITVSIHSDQRTAATAIYTPLDFCMTNCLTVDDQWRITVPCASYQGVGYTFKINYINELNWGLDAETLSETDYGKCQRFDENLNLAVTCAEIQGDKYALALSHTGNFIWDLAPESFQPMQPRHCLMVDQDISHSLFGGAFLVKLVDFDACEVLASFKIASREGCVYTDGELVACYSDVRVAFGTLGGFKAVINEFEYEFPKDGCRYRL